MTTTGTKFIGLANQRHISIRTMEDNSQLGGKRNQKHLWKLQKERVILQKRPMEFSVFVNNLPVRLDQYGLKGIFQKAGKVCDTYIPNRRVRRSQGRFGFVRFSCFEDANKSIQHFHGAVIRGNRLYVALCCPGQT